LNKRHLGDAAMALKREDLSSGLYYEKFTLLKMLISINILIGNDALELEQYVLENIFALEPPE